MLLDVWLKHKCYGSTDMVLLAAFHTHTHTHTECKKLYSCNNPGLNDLSIAFIPHPLFSHSSLSEIDTFYQLVCSGREQVI